MIATTGRKEHEKLEKYKGLKEELQTIWGVKASVVPVVIGVLVAVNPKLSRSVMHKFLCVSLQLVYM